MRLSRLSDRKKSEAISISDKPKALTEAEANVIRCQIVSDIRVPKDGGRGLRGERGEKGDQGERGDQGEIGPMPRHQWRGTELRFEQPSGEWGPFVDLKGPRGLHGASRVVSLGGLSEARVLELIETFMPIEVEYPRAEVDIAVADGVGPHTIYTPISGKAIRIRRYRVMPDPDLEDTPSMTLKIGSKFVQSGPALYGSDFIEGEIDQLITIELESAGRATGAVYYEEF